MHRELHGSMFFADVSLISRPDADEAKDDYIKIICPNQVGGEGVHTMMMKRSALERSGPLLKFFKSNHYRYGCGNTLHFTEVPGVAFDLVKVYLEKGPDLFTQASLMHRVSRSHMDTGNRMEIYTRLHKCARLLELGGLKNMAMAAIRAEQGGMTSQHCARLASFVFVEHSGFGRELKAWLMDHVKDNFDTLRTNPFIHANPDTTWFNIVSNLSPRFRNDWKSMMDAYIGTQAIHVATQLSPVDEEEDENAFQFLHDVPGGNDTGTATLVESSSAFIEAAQDKQKDTNPATVLQSQYRIQFKANTKENHGSEDVNGPGSSNASHDSATLVAAPHSTSHDTNPVASASIDRSAHHSTDDTKENAPHCETPDLELPRHQSLDLQNEKARQVLGINSPSGSAIAIRRKGNGLTRAAKSLTNLMRSPSSQGMDGSPHD